VRLVCETPSCAVLQGDLTALVGAAMFCTIAAALDAHVTEARRKGWCLPTQVVAGTHFMTA
jgi:hypothetical protein